jgi:hypothetical protein
MVLQAGAFLVKPAGAQLEYFAESGCDKNVGGAGDERSVYFASGIELAPSASADKEHARELLASDKYVGEFFVVLKINVVFRVVALD